MASDDEGVLIEVSGEGEGTVSRDGSHLVAVAMARLFSALGERPSGFVLRCTNAIPHGRGLGSSAAAIIGGLVLARAMVDEGVERLDDAALLALALELESHPDNLAAALHGGFTIAWLDDAGSVGVVRRDVHPQVRVSVIVPSGELATARARAALPAQVPLVDAAHNAGRSALLVHALTEDPSLLLDATSDRLHQEQRRGVYAESMAVVDALRAEGIAACISGAGPTVLAFAEPGSIATPEGWRLIGVPIAAAGARTLPA